MPGLSYGYGSICPLLTATTPNVGTTSTWDPNRTIRPPVSVVAYADDVAVFATTVADFSTIQEAIRLYEKASGTRLNPLKYKAIAVGRWSAFDTVLGIPYHSHVRIPSFNFWNSDAKSIKTRGHDSQHKCDYEQGKPTPETYAWPTACATSTHSCLPKYDTWPRYSPPQASTPND